MSHILKILVFATGMIPVLPFRILIIQKKVMLRGALSAIFVVSERNEMVMWRLKRLLMSLIIWRKTLP